MQNQSDVTLRQSIVNGAKEQFDVEVTAVTGGKAVGHFWANGTPGNLANFILHIERIDGLKVDTVHDGPTVNATVKFMVHRD